MGVRHQLDLVHALRKWSSEPGHEALVFLLDLEDALPRVKRRFLRALWRAVGMPTAW